VSGANRQALTAPWPDVLASALVGTQRTGGDAEALLDTVAAHALRRRAGVALVPGVPLPAPAPADPAGVVGPDAVARVDALLATDSAARDAVPVRDMAGRLDLLAEWLAAAAGRRIPPELVPALLDAGRRHHHLRPVLAEVAGPLAHWLAAQRPDWGWASAGGPASSTVDGPEVWELGSIGRRGGYLHRLRQRDPARARQLLESGWDTESPDDRAVLLSALKTGLTLDDEPLLERALDDRRRQVRVVAADLLGRLPDSAYGKRMAARARACVDLEGDGGPIGIEPPGACDRAMRRDGIASKPPAGTGERAWWLEEILARAPLPVWPAPAGFLARPVSDEWAVTVRRGLARAAAAQRDVAWALALVDPLIVDVATDGQPDDRLLLKALYDVLPPEELAARATASLDRGLVGAMAVELEHVLALCPRPWPPAVAEAVVAALEDHLANRGSGWRAAPLCELAALRLPADFAPRAAALVERVRAVRPGDPGVAFIERFAATLRFRRDMLEELA
jgi:Family of unknown function (DUF5691)